MLFIPCIVFEKIIKTDNDINQRIMKLPWSVVHFRQFRPNLHNIFAEEAVLCQELEESPIDNRLSY